MVLLYHYLHLTAMTKSYYLIPDAELNSASRVYVIRVHDTQRSQDALIELFGLCSIRGWYLQVRCPESIRFLWHLAANMGVHTYMVCDVTSAVRQLRHNVLPEDGRRVNNLWLVRSGLLSNFKL